MNQAVHQLRYRWSSSTLLGTRGMGPVESTLSATALTSWDRYLRDHVWVVGARPGFTYVTQGGVGAIVRKVAATSADGRPGSAAHVLISRDLTALCALGLTCWDGWDELASGELPWAALKSAADQGIKEVRARAQAVPRERLAGLFAQLLCAPGDRYTVIGEADPLAVTCALGDLVGRIPTFASDEADDNGQHLPTAVFLRQAPVASTVATRRRLQPMVVPSDPAISSFATAAAEAYTTDGLAGIARVQREQPPADLAEAREWAVRAQLAPGILADFTRLPRLRPAVLAGLLRLDALERVQAAARLTSSRDLAAALQGRLPDQIAAIVVHEAVARVLNGPADRLLLDRLAAIGPLPLAVVAANLPPDLDPVMPVVDVLLAPQDRDTLVARATAAIPYAKVIQWIHDHAGTNPARASAVYDAMCKRARKASRGDMRVLAERGALVDAVRQFSDSEREASARLVQHLAGLPKRALTRGIIIELVAHTDPVLLHALDTVVTSRAKRKVINRSLRLAYYEAHFLDEPIAVPRGNRAAHRKEAGSRWFSVRRTPTDHRKPT